MAAMLQTNAADPTNAAECAVCMAALSPRDIFYTPCSHAFHYDCIITWITQRSATCPNCRQTVMPMQIRRLHVTLAADATVENEIALHKAEIAALESDNVHLRETIKKWRLFSDDQNITIAKTSSLLSATQEELAAKRLQHAETTNRFELELAVGRVKCAAATEAWQYESAERKNYEETAKKLQSELGVERGNYGAALIAWQLKFDEERQKQEETVKKLQKELAVARNECAKQAGESKEQLKTELVRARQKNSETKKKLEIELAAERQKSGEAAKKLEKELAALRQKYEEMEKELKKELAEEREQHGGTAKELEKAQLVQLKETSSDARRVNKQRIEKPTKQLPSTKKAKVSHPNPAKTRPLDIDGIAARTRSQTRMMR